MTRTLVVVAIGLITGTGLAGGSAAATLGEMGYNVKSFCFQDSPRRAHSVAAQGGINAAKNYKNDGDSVYRLFYDTIKGGDYRSREGNVHRLAEVGRRAFEVLKDAGEPRLVLVAEQLADGLRQGQPADTMRSLALLARRLGVQSAAVDVFVPPNPASPGLAAPALDESRAL